MCTSCLEWTRNLILYNTSSSYFDAASPVFESSLQNIVTPPDRDITLSCAAQGSPMPTYSWSRLNGAIPSDALSSATSGDLRLFTVTSDSAGMYVCTATNSFGSATSMTTLDVLGTIVLC